MVRSQKSLLDVDTDPKGHNLKIAECCWVHFSPISQFLIGNQYKTKTIEIPLRNFKIGEKWTQQHSAILKLRPFGSVSTSKSDFYDRTVFRDFLAKILFFHFLTGLLKEIT